MLFRSDGDREAALDDMRRRWPRARFVADQTATAPYAERVFDQGQWRQDAPLRVVMIGGDFEKSAVATTPLGRIGQPDDIAHVAVFLASGDSGWITGERVLASGGRR